MSGFYFAWCDGPEAFSEAHHVYDEKVFSFTVQGKEGEICTLSLTIENPRVGLLSAGRKLWAWLSWYDGTSVTPIFHGRLVGIPSNVFDERVELSFVAKPLDYGAQRRALALSLADLPAYDPLFVDPNLRVTEDGGDPSVVLEGIPSRWHVSRGEDGQIPTVTASNITAGEDGTEAFTAGSDGVAYDSLGLTFEQPLLSVTVKAQVEWTQKGTGPAIDLGTMTIPTYTQTLLSDWPKAGASLGGGWAAAPGTLAVDLYGVDAMQTQTQNFQWSNPSKKHSAGDTMSLSISDCEVICRGPFFRKGLTLTQIPGVFGLDVIDETGASDVVNIPLHVDATWVVVPQSLVFTNLLICYEAGRKRTEHCTFTVTSDVQAVLTLPGDFDTGSGATASDEMIIEVNGADVTVPIDGVSPLTDDNAGNYFSTARGLQSIEYLLMRARAQLLAGARIATLSWSCSFDRALGLTCRKSASLTDRRLPGGIASGKIIEYTIFADGSTGKMGGTVTAGCTVGHDGTVSAVAGEPDIWEEDFIESGFQQYSGVTSTIGTDLGYTPPNPENNNLLPYSKDDVVLKQELHGSAEEQLEIIRANAASWFKSGGPDFAKTGQPYINAVNQDLIIASKNTLAAQEAAQKAQDELDTHAVWLELDLKSVDQLALDNELVVPVTQLKVPKTIDFEAVSSP